jgi:hypothetical protein
MKAVVGILAFLSLAFTGVHASATSLSLTNLSDSDMKKIVGDLTTNFMHTSVSGASGLGHIFGFEIGIVGGQTSTPHLNDVVHETDPTVSADTVYDAALLGVLTVPFGISAEIGLLPSVGKDDFKASATSVAAKWTLTESVLDLPFSLAAKASYTTANIKAKQDVGGVSIDYKYDNTDTVIMGIVSKNFVIVEPYFGLGVVSGRGELSGSGTSIYANGSTSGSANRSSTTWMVGAELKLLVVKLGLEYANAFDTNRIAGKLSFFF